MKNAKKKNRWIAPVICVVILALLIGAYVTVTAINNKKAADEAAEAAKAAEKITLADSKSIDINYIEYTYNGELIKLEYKNDFWYNAEDNYFPLNQTQPAAMAEATAIIKVERLVEDSDANFEAYGLNEPYAEITVGYKNGTGLSMIFGSLNGFTGTRYMYLGGTTKVYMINTALLDSFKFTHNDLINHDTIEKVDISALTEISMTTTDGAAEGVSGIARYYNGGAAEDGTTVWLFDNGSGEPVQVDAESVKTLLDSVQALSLVNCAAYNVRDDETFASYGLGTAAASTITVKYTVTMEVTDESSAISSTAAKTLDKEYSVNFSLPDENNITYVNKTGSKLIYALSEQA